MRQCRKRAAAAVAIAVAVTGLGLTSIAVSSAAPPDQPRPSDVALFALANAARADAGVVQLRWSDALWRAATAHNQDEIDNGCYDHNSCDGTVWSKRVGSYYPGWTSLRENIGGGHGPEEAQDQWMASSGHKTNILAPDVLDFGGSLLGTSGAIYTLKSRPKTSRVSARRIPNSSSTPSRPAPCSSRTARTRRSGSC